ncbi:MAG: hypothetical protein PHW24_02440 [Candidatus Moranbacteria bacterium]|nr:hypothetical protein [Candidatus Moranbacteria bacterium]
MHQTFYIDIEEEISSVVDRLNKSMSVDNYFVVPKRALFLQSIVNLKLLKREADKVGKKVFIVTQDEIGASMAERSGIEVLASLDETAPSVNDAFANGELEDGEYDEDDEDEMGTYEPVSVQQDQDKSIRLRSVGSNNFYDATENFGREIPEKNIKAIQSKAVSRRIPVNSVSHHSLEEKKPIIQKQFQYPSQSPAGPVVGKPALRAGAQSFAGSAYHQQLDPNKAKSLEKMFSANKAAANASESPTPVREKRIKKVVVGFVILCLFVFVGTAVFLFLPSAKIVITPNVLKDKIDLVLNATNALPADDHNIAVRVIDKEESITLPYEISGSSSVGGKKAHGTVVIYNEFDNNPQTLIATTRLESEDGKIFRLQKNIVVPGRSTVAGEVKPGAVSAEVIADQAGSDFNIGPVKFNIPGFKDSPKYDKFYAKSTEQMVGGSSDGTSSAGGVASQKDIDNAKQKTQDALTEKINQEIKGGLSDSEILLDEAEKVTITKSSAGVKVGDMVSTFNYTATASVRVLVFSETDVRSIIEKSINGANDTKQVKKVISKIEYGTSNADFDKNIIELKVHSEITSTPIIDSEQIKKELLGKTDDQLPAILRKYPTIKNVNVEFSPSFVTRISQYAQRVSVQIATEGN